MIGFFICCENIFIICRDRCIRCNGIQSPRLNWTNETRHGTIERFIWIKFRYREGFRITFGNLWEITRLTSICHLNMESLAPFQSLSEFDVFFRSYFYVAFSRYTFLSVYRQNGGKRNRMNYFVDKRLWIQQIGRKTNCARFHISDCF